MRFGKLLLIFSLSMLIPLSGCLPKSNTVKVPSSSVTLKQATEINLKILDLTKITTGETKEVLGYHFDKVEGAKLIEYRYPKKPIKIKIAKFENSNIALDFWRNWTGFLRDENKTIELKEPEPGKNFWEFKTSNNKVLAWQENLWFTCIEVPIELQNSAELSQKVKEIINLHYEQLSS